MNIPFRQKNTITEAIQERDKFRSGPLRAHSLSPGYLPGTGDLPDEWAILLRAEQPSYIIISYRTPIAWWSERLGWTVPEVTYSVTTSRHQNAVRAALQGDKARS